MQRLQVLLRGIRRSQGGRLTKPQRAPITVHHLHSLYAYIIRRYSDKDACMLWAAFTSAFFGLLRASEFTAPSESTSLPSTLMFRHVTVAASQNEVTFLLPMSKTDSYGHGAKVHFVARHTPCCPVTALISFSHYHPCPSGPLFMFQDGGYLTRTHIASLLSFVFPNQPNLNTHSFRIGGASALSAAGVPDYIIKIIGRWSSDSFLRYIRLSSSTIASYQLRIGDRI